MERESSSSSKGPKSLGNEERVDYIGRSELFYGKAIKGYIHLPFFKAFQPPINVPGEPPENPSELKF